MATWHFAEIGDVWKHLPLAEILAAHRPARYWESHTGSATYELSRSPDRDYGVYHFLDHAGDECALAESRYVRTLQQLADDAPYRAVYPGSPALASLILGRSAREYVFCDVDPESVGNLERAARSHRLDDETPPAPTVSTTRPTWSAPTG